MLIFCVLRKVYFLKSINLINTAPLFLLFQSDNSLLPCCRIFRHGFSYFLLIKEKNNNKKNKRHRNDIIESYKGNSIDSVFQLNVT